MSTVKKSVFERAFSNIGAPPMADAYCRVLAMEVERLAREDCAKVVEGWHIRKGGFTELAKVIREGDRF